VAGQLAQVTWVVTNQQYSEHPDGAPTDGAYYIGKVLQALAADPDVFNSTLVIIDFDENDGQFDHVPPPVPPAGTPDEFYTETGSSVIPPIPLPTGLGFRVPLLLVSPWTRGGWVTSEVSDHTSVVQFLEKWTTAIGKPALCPNISDWRRSVCGDLTSAFDFEHPVYGLPNLPFVSAPVGEAHSYHPVPASDVMPMQESGTKPARSLPYQPNANLTGLTTANGTVTANLALSNTGQFVGRSAHFSVYDNTLTTTPSLANYPAGFPGQFTVAGSSTDATAATTVTFAAGAGPAYDITVTGPNRFLRRFTGNRSKAGANVTVAAGYFHQGFRPKFTLNLVNGSASAVNFTVTTNNYGTAAPVSYHVPAGQTKQHNIDPITNFNGWYDLTVTIDTDASWSQRFTGHLENGKPSITG
jgi:phospholipase C